MEGLQRKVDVLLAHNELVEQQLWEEIQKGEGLLKEVDDLTTQADQLEQQLKEEIEKGEIRLKRLKIPRGKPRGIFTVRNTTHFIYAR
jgi:hypothetical protein